MKKKLTHNNNRIETATIDLESIFKEQKSKKGQMKSKSKNKQNNKKKFSFREFFSKKWVKITLIIVLILTLFTGGATYFAYQQYKKALALKDQIMQVKAEGMMAFNSFKSKKLPETLIYLDNAEKKLQEVKSQYQEFTYLSKLPKAKIYYADGQNLIVAGEEGLAAAKKAVKAIEPYSDMLGFSGEGSFMTNSAEDKIKIVINTLDKVMPAYDDIINHLKKAQTELMAINAQDYPEAFREIVIRKNIIEAQEKSQLAIDLADQFKPVIQQIPTIAGSKNREGKKKYLILFQNDNELRPTGGFLTAYALVWAEDGKVTPIKSDDIYEVDQEYGNQIKIPEKIGRFLTTENYWHLRDMNIWPDFKKSMDQFYQEYQTVPGEPDDIDGIITVDTHVLTGLLEILGPAQVPGFGEFSAETIEECDCPQVVYALSEIITKPTPYIREDRKGVLGPLMQTILTKTYGAPKQYWEKLFTLLWESLQGRHVQLYFMDEDNQIAAENINAAGRLPEAETVKNKDFIAIVNANLGGAKSNLFTDYEVKQVINQPSGNFITKQVEIVYSNDGEPSNCDPEAGELCLNATLKDWTRIYLPQGSELINAQGFLSDYEIETYEEDGFFVIDGYFTLEPKKMKTIKLEYKVPYQNQEQYEMLMWKQGGINPVPVLMDVTGGQETFTLDSDHSYQTKF